jgi:hypothetical protein
MGQRFIIIGCEALTVDQDKNILSLEEIAQYMRKSLSWVYKNAELLGARRLKGSLFFSARKNL